ncbi:hypothetical protein pEaSNUABM49_00168 [Erwinia phage pEa_SNUABM_49]|nr:hypothetical protein pEaSNUABM49_00168 [Erwinia phage pEa_SNUABM_49]
MRPLIAICIEDDQGGTFYHNPTIINSYQDAVKFQLENDVKLDGYIEFLLYPENLDLNEVIENIEYCYSDYDDYFDLEELTRYFNLTAPLYKDGTVAKIGDSVIIYSEDLLWGYMTKNVPLYGTVTNIDNLYRIQFRIEPYEKEMCLDHFRVNKLGENNE